MNLAADGAAIYRITSPYGCGTASPTTQTSGPVSSPSGCLDVSSTATSTQPVMATCTGTPSQRYTLRSDGTIRVAGSGACLAATSTAPAAAVRLATCDATAAQRWTLGSTGNLTNGLAANMCLDVYGGVGHAPVTTFPCGASQPNQIWRTPLGPPTGQLHTMTYAANQGTCLSTTNGAVDSGTLVVSAPCDGSAAQRWTLPGDGTIRVAGKCLDDSQSLGAGTKQIIYSCTGNPNQRWTYTTNGNLINGANGLCLDVPGASTTPGTVVDLAPCGHNEPNQIWTVPQ